MLQMTLTVRDPKTEARFTHIQKFEGERQSERALSVVTAMINGWIVRDKNELLVLTIVDTRDLPNIAEGE